MAPVAGVEEAGRPPGGATGGLLWSRLPGVGWPSTARRAVFLPTSRAHCLPVISGPDTGVGTHGNLIYIRIGYITYIRIRYIRSLCGDQPAGVHSARSLVAMET